ncbi:hypothetical protein Tco_1533295 [Tanacetum coccineum]
MFLGDGSRDDVGVSTVWDGCSNSSSESDNKIISGVGRLRQVSMLCEMILETIVSLTMPWEEFRDYCVTHNVLGRVRLLGDQLKLESGVSDEARETLFVFATTRVAPNLLDFATTMEVNKALLTLEFIDKA